MNTVVTSKEEILQTSRELIRRQGWSAVSIRSVAAACGVSVGSIYNYFDSKADLVAATVESVWAEIFHRPQDVAVFEDIQACVTWMYQRMAYGCERYPGFFTLHSLGFMREDKSDGKRRHAADLATYFERSVRCPQEGREDSRGCLHATVYRGEIRRGAVFPHALRAAATELRPFRRAGNHSPHTL